MSHRSEAQLVDAIQKAQDELAALRFAKADDYLAEDTALLRAMEKVKKSYKDRNWLELKNAAQYIAEIKHELAPATPDAEADWAEISAPNFGAPFPPNWGMTRDYVIPRGKYIIFNAPPKTGKTRAALSLALHLANIGHRVSFLSGEMPTSQLWLLLWMQRFFLETGKSYGEFEARAIMAGKDTRNIPIHESYHNFRREYGKKIWVAYTPGWSARRTIYGHKLSENLWGKPATAWFTDYAQILGKDPSAKDMRESHINNSLTMTVATGIAGVAHILVSQVNDLGVTAESSQYERDAGMVINFSREADKVTGEKSDMLKIHIKHSRSTPSRIFTAHMDVKSGAIVPSAAWRPADAQGRFDD